MARLNPAGAVRAWFAARMLPRPTDGEQGERVGDFTLHRSQARTLHSILQAIEEFGGVLVADPPGSGKTVLALAAADRMRDGASVLVVAPAAIRAQWNEAAARAEVPVHFVSHEALSRGNRPPEHGVVIVDEAHHARTPTTRRYQSLARACRDARVLLLSATPVVNRASDRDALLALFLGARATTLTAQQTARCVVRAGDGEGRPPVRRLGAIGRGVGVPGLADAIAALPPPVPVEGGSPARALVILSLATAWRSSLAALDTALRRRIQRGDAMLDLFRSGHAPSRTMLRHWVLHDDATQLAFESLLGTSSGDREDRRVAVHALARHLAAVRAMRETIRPHLHADAVARAAAVRALSAAHPDRRLVVFARHVATVRALRRALRTVPGVVAIIGSRVEAAAGRWSREEVLRALGPRAGPLAAAHTDAREIRILLATDVVAEGVEMQGVGIVVHADLPWTPARMEQRLGRVTRIGSAQPDVMEARFAAPHGARALLRLGERLRHKRDARRAATRDAIAQERIARLLSRWRGPDDDEVSSAMPRIAAAHARSDGFVALIDRGGEPSWLVGERCGGRWRVSSSPRSVLRSLRRAGGPSMPLGATDARVTIRLVDRILARRAASRLMRGTGQPAATGPATAHRRTTRIRARLARILERAPGLVRTALASRHAGWLQRLERPLGVAREHDLDALLGADLDDATFARRLALLLSGRDAVKAKSRPEGSGRLDALLILRSVSAPLAARARPAASIESAATR